MSKKLKKGPGPFLILLIVYVFLGATAGFAEIKDIGFEHQHSVKIPIRSDDDDYNLYSTRTQANLDYSLPGSERIFRISPFFEYQSNFDTNTWWRKELGAEVGTSFFNDCFYVGASFQHVWHKEENYPIELLDETTEWVSRFVISPPLPWDLFKEKLKLRLFNEYTYDFNRGQGTFNEVGAVVEWQVSEHLKFPIGWSHLDRVHDFDSDALRFSALFSF